MAKNKPDGLTHYELLYIVSNQFSEDELGPIKNKVENVITEHQGVITFKESLGKRRLAYKIKQFRHGYYELVEFDAESASVPAINDLLRLMSDLIRHQILKCVAKTAEEKQKEIKLISQLANETVNDSAKESLKKDRPEAPKTAARTSVGKVEETKLEDTVAKTSAIEKQSSTGEAAEAQTSGAPKANLSDSDLDDKLNQILNTDSLL